MPFPIVTPPLSVLRMPETAVSVTVDPWALVRRDLSLGAEFALARRRSVAVSAKLPGLGLRPSAWDARVQYREYLVGSFDTGLGVGAEAAWSSPGGSPKLGMGTPQVGAFAVAKLTLAMFVVDVRGGASLLDLPNLEVAPTLGVGVGIGF